MSSFRFTKDKLVITKQKMFKTGASVSGAMGEIATMQPDLAIVLGSAAHFVSNGRLDEVKKGLPLNTLLVRCPTAGNISYTGVEDDALVITACKFAKSTLHSAASTLNRMDNS